MILRPRCANAVASTGTRAIAPPSTRSCATASGYNEQGKTLTFGAQPFKWKELDAAAGEYVVGFIVEDLDGNPQPVFERIVVR
jgi:hypothetical protein